MAYEFSPGCSPLSAAHAMCTLLILYPALVLVYNEDGSGNRIFNACIKCIIFTLQKSATCPATVILSEIKMNHTL